MCLAYNFSFVYISHISLSNIGVKKHQHVGISRLHTLLYLWYVEVATIIEAMDAGSFVFLNVDLEGRIS